MPSIDVAGVEIDLTMVSQAIGYAIIAASFSLKLPQILKIVRAGSAKGVSEATTMMELFCFSTSFYNGYKKQFPLETYAENAIIVCQLFALYLLIIMYNGNILSPTRWLFLAALGGYSYAFLTGQFDIVIEGVPGNMPLTECFNISTVAVGVMSKLPQIVTFISSRSTGNAAFLTWFMQFGGSCARTFTTLMQVDDMVLLFAYVINAVLGGIIVACFLVFPGDVDIKTKKE